MQLTDKKLPGTLMLMLVVLIVSVFAADNDISTALDDIVSKISSLDFTGVSEEKLVELGKDAITNANEAEKRYAEITGQKIEEAEKIAAEEARKGQKEGITFTKIRNAVTDNYERIIFILTILAAIIGGILKYTNLGKNILGKLKLRKSFVSRMIAYIKKVTSKLRKLNLAGMNIRKTKLFKKHNEDVEELLRITEKDPAKIYTEKALIYELIANEKEIEKINKVSGKEIERYEKLLKNIKPVSITRMAEDLNEQRKTVQKVREVIVKKDWQSSEVYLKGIPIENIERDMDKLISDLTFEKDFVNKELWSDLNKLSTAVYSLKLAWSAENVIIGQQNKILDALMKNKIEGTELTNSIGAIKKLNDKLKEVYIREIQLMGTLLEKEKMFKAEIESVEKGVAAEIEELWKKYNIVNAESLNESKIFELNNIPYIEAKNSIKLKKGEIKKISDLKNNVLDFEKEDVETLLGGTGKSKLGEWFISEFNKRDLAERIESIARIYRKRGAEPDTLLNIKTKLKREIDDFYPDLK
ncbi:MAG: hypothetical protein AABW88_03725 [Nanoarchaeota archaeon]